MKIGVPKETNSGEWRVAMTPDIAKKFINRGFQVHIEHGAGVAAYYLDQQFTAVGAQLVSREDCFNSDIILKVRRPSAEEVELIRAGSVYIGFMESCGQDPLIDTMRDRDIQVLAMERLPRISRAQSMDALSSQSNLAGYRATLEAASQYRRFFPAMMTAAGAAKPARVVVLGAGVAGLQAIATARRLGADVRAYDVRPETEEQIRSLGAKPIHLAIAESGQGQGGYARELSEASQAQQQAALAQELITAQIIITTALIPCRPAPELIPESVVQQLAPGSVIVDLAAATGGNCKLTQPDRVIEQYGVTLVGYTNYPALIAADASAFYAKNLANLLALVVTSENNKLTLCDLTADEITRAMLITSPLTN
jgi:NAD(P) transhydrogenase subunit alpha